MMSMETNKKDKSEQLEQVGTIIKALSGFYYVRADDALRFPSEIQCRARGVFKKKGLTPLVGDRVRFSMTDNGEGTVTELFPRSSELVRPPVANIDLAILVFSVTEPSLNLQLLDKFLVHIEHADIPAVLCLSKKDLEQDGDESEEAKAMSAAVNEIYGAIGYEVYSTSAKRNNGIGELRERLKGHLAVFAGQSGVGKSSLLNTIVPGLQLETNAISNRLGRGKHTTRHVELIDIGGGLVADTPGFSQLDFVELGVDDLSSCFVEMRELSPNCKFRGCTHIQEPGCAVLEALEEGRLAPSRHEHYKLFLEEMKEKKRRY
ncbi:ribosome small subunit-dependent GTPase A [Paenibacillus sp. GXUN7292]|uniref:ribosome small subunit-dependent GTPase A n=1 Tax=Paenibacillus sp. GXUN7292 TaxID=3422499 RepID=UPI003D7D8F36